MDFFHIKKGALLIHDNVFNIFQAWSLTGFDNTTSSHLRIPAQIMETVTDNNNKPFISDVKKLKILNPYFSSRESGLLDSALIIPFYLKNNQLFAVILITDFNLSEINSRIIIDNSELFIDTFTGHLSFFYENIRLKTDTAEKALKHDLIGKLMDTADKKNYKNPFIVFFDFVRFFEIISARYPHLSFSGFKNIIIRLFSSFIINNGKIFIVAGKALCLIINSPSLNDKILIEHQIMFIIKNLLPSFSEKEKYIMKVFQIDSDSESLKDFINADFF